MINAANFVVKKNIRQFIYIMENLYAGIAWLHTLQLYLKFQISKF